MSILALRGPATRAQDRAVAACMALGQRFGKLARDRRGAAAVEYGFLVALVVLAILVALTQFGRANLDIWTNVAAKVTAT